MLLSRDFTSMYKSVNIALLTVLLILLQAQKHSIIALHQACTVHHTPQTEQPFFSVRGVEELGTLRAGSSCGS